VAVGRGFGDRGRRDLGAGSRAVFDDDGLLELVLQLLRQHAGQDVGAAAGRERTDEGHGALRVVVAVGRGAEHRNGNRSETRQQAEHGILSHLRKSAFVLTAASPLT
jgi:hypothetical protein